MDTPIITTIHQESQEYLNNHKKYTSTTSRIDEEK
jgi:hypothetical protein